MQIIDLALYVVDIWNSSLIGTKSSMSDISPCELNYAQFKYHS